MDFNSNSSKSQDGVKIIQINEQEVKDHLSKIVTGTVEETLNALLDAEADQLCGAARYEYKKKD